MNIDIVQTISTLGFPIVSCIALGWFCKYMIDNNNQHINKMFEMYDKANYENRNAIENCTNAVNALVELIKRGEV